jgi:hypothetical protein
MNKYWTNKPGFSPDKKDYPRRLTQDEIEEIVSTINRAYCDDAEAGKVIIDSLRNKYRRDLTFVTLCPSKIPEFKKTFSRKYRLAKAQIGEGVGVMAADAHGASSTQVALNTFHVSGAATTVISGIEGLKSLIFAHRPKKNKSTTINLKNQPANYQEAYNMRSELEGLSIRDLILEEDINIESYGYLKQNLPHWWYSIYESIYGRVESSDDVTVMRLKLNMKKMIFYEISMEELVSYIDQLSVRGKDLGSTFLTVFSPLSESIIDIHLIDTTGIDSVPGMKLLTETHYFRNATIPEFGKAFIRGIPLIKKVYPVSWAVWEKSMLYVRKVYDDELNTINKVVRGLPKALKKKDLDYVSFVELNVSQMRRLGISYEELDNLLQSIRVFYGFTDDKEKNKMYVYNLFSKKSISKFIRERKNGFPHIVEISDAASVSTRKEYRLAQPFFYGEYVYVSPVYFGVIENMMNSLGYSISDESITGWRAWTFKDNKPYNVYSIEIPSPEKYNSIEEIILYKMEIPDFVRDSVLENAVGELIYKDRNVIYINYRGILYLPLSANEDVSNVSSKGWSNGGLKRNMEFEGEKLVLYKKINLVKLDEIQEEELKQKIHDDYLSRQISDDVANELKLDEDNFFPVFWDGEFYLAINSDKHLTELESILSMRNFGIELDEDTERLYLKNVKNGDKYINIVIQEPEDRSIEIDVRKLKFGKSFQKYLKETVDKDDKLTIDEQKSIKKGDYNSPKIQNYVSTMIIKYVMDQTKVQSYDHWFLSTRDKEDSGKFTLTDVLSDPLIDPLKTYNNNMHDINEILGVEAAYSYFIKALKDLNASGGVYIDPRHILLLADFIFSRGRPNGVLFTGLARQPIGALSLITIERAMEVLKKLAITTNVENINSVSAAISTGQKTPLGTGMFSMSNDRRFNDLEKLYDDQLNTISAAEEEATDKIIEASYNNLKYIDGDNTKTAIPSATSYASTKTKIYDDFETLLNEVIEKGKFIEREVSPDTPIVTPDLVIPPLSRNDTIDSIFNGTMKMTVSKQIKKIPKVKTETKTKLEIKGKRVRTNKKKEEKTSKFDLDAIMD